ncbi:hypothetical protein ABIB51_000183 [Arthrobacter sp. UYCu712]
MDQKITYSGTFVFEGLVFSHKSTILGTTTSIVR